MSSTMLVTGDTAGRKTPRDPLGGDRKREDKLESRIVSVEINAVVTNQSAVIRGCVWE